MTQAVKHPASHREPLAAGIATFAAVMLVIGGVLGILRGIMAIANDSVFVNTPDYVFEFNVEGWGWIHLALGIVALMTGLSLFRFTLWARVAGVAIAGLLLVSSFPVAALLPGLVSRADRPLRIRHLGAVCRPARVRRRALTRRSAGPLPAPAAP